MKKNLFFSSPPRSFSNMATLTKHCILRYESYFLVFWVFDFFFEKLIKKNNWNIHLPKKSKNDPRGTPKYTQNPEKMAAKSPKIPKNAKKVDFLRGRFLDEFLDGQKWGPKWHGPHRPGPVGVMLAVLASPNILKNKMLCNLICHLNHLKEDLDLTRRGSGELINNK